MSIPEVLRKIRWTRERAALLGILCLAAGLGGGWYARDILNPVKAESGPSSGTAASSTGLRPTSSGTNGAGLKEAADAKAAPLLDQLKSDPDNLEVLTNLGNLYYDAQQYSSAVGFYQRALKLRPADVSVRTDLGTAYWYLGNADAALTQFDTALSFSPSNPNTLFNRGLVKWQGKKDREGATADWKKLLATSPDYQGKENVEKMLAEVATQNP